MREITFDIESISNSAVRGRVDVNEQELTVVAIHDSETGEYSAFFRDDLHKLWPILERADVLIGYNSDAFDIPLLNRYYPGELTRIRSLDLMLEVQKMLGRRIRLQTLAEATLGKSKKGDGMKAQDWWRDGERDKVAEYCIEDVRLKRELYDFARENNLLRYKDLGQIRDIKLETTRWNLASDSPSSLTHALPI